MPEHIKPIFTTALGVFFFYIGLMFMLRVPPATKQQRHIHAIH